MAIVLRILKWLGLGAVAVVLLVYGVLYMVNWRDQPASEEAKKLAAIYSDHVVVAEQDNGYVFAMGFAAPEGQDPVQRGVERIAWIEGVAGKPGSVEEPQRPTYDPVAHRSAVMKQIFNGCVDVNAACVEALKANEQGVAEWVEANGWLLARYQALLAHTAWLATSPPDYRAPLPSFSAVMEGQRALLMRAWLLAGQGDAAGVRALLDPDVQFWRHTMASSGTLLTKMVASAALTRHFTWANLALRRLPPDQAMAAMPESWLQPLSEEERSLQRVLAGEWKLFDVMLNQSKRGEWEPFSSDSAQGFEATMDRIGWLLIKPFLQVQDSSNRYAEYLMKIAGALDVPFAQFPAALEHAQRIEQEYPQAQPPFSRVYNMVGDIISGIAAPTFTSYGPRIYDVEGVRRLTLLAVQLRGRGVSREELPQQLDSADLRDPYMEKPFGWDAASGTLVFTGMVKGERGHHALLY